MVFRAGRTSIRIGGPPAFEVAPEKARPRALVPVPDTVFLLAMLAVLVHFVAATRYPVFRDELYYLDCARHLAWGFVDHPPLSIAVLAIWVKFLGASQFSLNVIPSISHGVLVVLVALLARRLGGRSFAQITASIAALIAPGYLALTSFYSMNAFDLSFWAAAYLLLARALERSSTRDWLLLGLVLGLGLLNKISLLLFGAGLLIAVVATPERRHLGTTGPWLTAAVSLLLFLPHVLWQRSHGWPTLEFMANAAGSKNAELGPGGFLIGQLLQLHPFNIVVALLGLGWLFLSFFATRFRVFGWIWMVAFATLLLQNSKPYYLDAANTVLLAAGAVAIEAWADHGWRRWMRYLTPPLLLAGGVLTAPFALPLLSVERFVAYQKRSRITPPPAERHVQGVLPQHFADRFGWPELTEAVATAYQTIPADDRMHLAIVARNYGQAGAINYYGPRLGLPRAYSQHNSHFYWPPPQKTRTFLLIGHERRALEATFESVVEVGRSPSHIGMPYETNRPIYLCRGLKVSFDDAWSRGKLFI